MTENFTQLCGHGGREPAALSHSGGHEMSKKERIVRYTDKKLREMQNRGEDMRS
jgi:hypothetical protein